ncbi:MAG TPA: sulfite exporter TauE/SafE family protein [Ignavibacteriales bacterium]|nr:sulfite exporter TauE/SafE family protein [Ignavibacteriales bacterium]
MDVNNMLLIAVVSSFLLAFVFSMFGQGGGSVYSPLLILLGYLVVISTSTSLVLNLITSVSAGYVFYKNKMIDYKASFMFVPGIVVGAFAGGVMSKFVNSAVLLWLFVFFLIVLGARMLYSYWEKGKTEENPPAKLSTSTYVLIISFSMAVGLISGLLGVGGGILIVPFMTYVLRYPTKSAAGSSHLIISFSALAGILGHASSHHLDIPLILVTGIAVLIGGNLGARFSLKVKPRMIKAGLGLLMWALSAQILAKLLGYL